MCCILYACTSSLCGRTKGRGHDEIGPLDPPLHSSSHNSFNLLYPRFYFYVVHFIGLVQLFWTTFLWRFSTFRCFIVLLLLYPALCVPTIVTYLHRMVFAARCYAEEQPMPSCDVCLSVCLSRSSIVSKRVIVSSNFFHHRVATPF